jgi:hypothetical protein
MYKIFYDPSFAMNTPSNEKCEQQYIETQIQGPVRYDHLITESLQKLESQICSTNIENRQTVQISLLDRCPQRGPELESSHKCFVLPKRDKTLKLKRRKEKKEYTMSIVTI